MRWLNTKYDQMDEIDFEIMSLLYILEEQPFTEIQKALKKSPTVIDGRLKKLLRRGQTKEIVKKRANIKNRSWINEYWPSKNNLQLKR